MLTLLYFLIILGITVFIHEFGHFLFAKKSGIYVYEFSIGMGPQIFKFHRKNDETMYSIRLFPIGGYVSMAGEVVEEDNEIPKEKQMTTKPWHNRFLTVGAGILFNFLLAFVIFFIIGLCGYATKREVYIRSIEENYPASNTNLSVGDEIISLNGKGLYSSDMLTLELQVNVGETLKLKVRHTNGEYETITIEPKEEDGTYYYGFGLETKENPGIIGSLQYAYQKVISLVLQMIFVIWYLITGKLSLSALSGPVGIYSVVGESAKAGFINLVYLTGYISLNVGFVNFLPIPAMDGGRLFFLIIEKIKGSPVNQKFENTVHTVGLALLMVLMLYVTFNDIIRIL